jgi:hypothetical protein
MKRRTFDAMITLVGLGVTIALIAGSALLNWGYSFANNTVSSQLKAQQITLPATTGNSAESADVTAFFKANGNKLMTTGKQAQMYADHYLGFHLSKMGTYAEASTAARAAAGTDKAASANATLETVFKGTTLRGTLLTAYAFWELGQIARIASGVVLAGGILLFFFVLAGWRNLRRTPEDATI